MKPRLLIHMGAGKCGSSAIQYFLRDNAAALLERGWLVPDRNCATTGPVTGQHNFFFDDFMELGVADAEASARDHFERLARETIALGAHTIVLSCENLINPEDRASRLGALKELFDVSLLLYVRRQLDYLSSAWQQWYVKVVRDKQQFMDQSLGVIANWDKCLAPWETVFGLENISVRRYGRGLLKSGDVVADYCAAVDLDIAGLQLPAREVNRSYADAITCLAEHNSGNYNSMNDDGFYRWLESLLGNVVYRQGSASSYPFAGDDIARIESAYAPGNAALVERYFPELAGQALFPPLPDAQRCTADTRQVAAQASELASMALAALDTQAGEQPYRYRRWRTVLETVAKAGEAGG